jgi:hypothetical protein
MTSFSTCTVYPLLWYQWTSTTQKKHTKSNSMHVSCAASYTLYLLSRAYTYMANDIHIPFGRPGWEENTNIMLQKMLLTWQWGTNRHTVMQRVHKRCWEAVHRCTTENFSKEIYDNVLLGAWLQIPNLWKWRDICSLVFTTVIKEHTMWKSWPH